MSARARGTRSGSVSAGLSELHFCLLGGSNDQSEVPRVAVIDEIEYFQTIPTSPTAPITPHFGGIMITLWVRLNLIRRPI